MAVSAFVPYLVYITSITNAQNAVVGFSAAHNFTDGEYVSFRVSQPFGMFEMNNRRALVLSHDTLSITTDIDSSRFNSFIYPVSGDVSPPVAVPAGSGIIPGSDPSTVNLQDAFDDVRL